MGIEQERFVESFSQDLVCCICLFVLDDPVECKTCQTNFCSECIKKVLETKKMCPNQCPLELQKSHRFLRSTLSNLSLRCINNDLGCDKILKLEQIKSHEALECQFRRAKCKYSTCQVILSIKDLESHEETCKFKSITCSDCKENLFIHQISDHSCIKMLKERIHSLCLEYENNLEILKKVKDYQNNRLFELNHQVHQGSKCSNCDMDPIRGVMNICSKCPTFRLCWSCYPSTHHEHSFYQLPNTLGHFGVTCDSCFTQPIQGLRFKCQICDDFDLCYSCRVNKEHPHDFHVLVPFDVHVVPVKPDRISYKNGDNFIRQWEIFNNSTQTIDSILMEVIGGDACIRNYRIYFGDLKILPLSWNVLTVKENVFQPIPGIYHAEFRLRTESRFSFFGPPLSYSLVVIPSSAINK